MPLVNRWGGNNRSNNVKYPKIHVIQSFVKVHPDLLSYTFLKVSLFLLKR